jgi:hypothetical protein
VVRGSECRDTDANKYSRYIQRPQMRSPAESVVLFVEGPGPQIASLRPDAATQL